MKFFHVFYNGIEAIKMHSTVILMLLVLSSITAMDMNDLENAKEEEIRRYFEETASEGRVFNFDRGNAFNTSVAFTIPLFSFTLPGAQDSINSGLDDGNTFGVLAFVALFLLSALGVAIFTTSQGGNANGRSLYSPYLDTEEGNSFTSMVLDAIYELPNAIDVQSCYHLGVCQAYAHPTEYGTIGKIIRWFTGIGVGTSKWETSPIGKAAEYGKKGEDECYYEYPCLVDPLDSIIFLKDAAYNKIASIGSKFY